MRRLQGFVTELLRVAFASFRKLYDLLRDGVPSRADHAVTLLKGDYGHLEGEPKRRAVSAPNLWPCKYCLIGIGVMLPRQSKIAGEMTHRVKNLLQIASALTQITSRSAATKEDMVRDLTSRLMRA